MKIQSLFRVLSGFLSSSKQNANSDRIEAAFQNTLSRDGSAPNAMDANLDMNSHRVINLGAPVNANDAVRLTDIEGIVAGDFEIAADWDDIVDKPSTFPPSTHVHSSTDITDFQERTEDLIGSSVTAGTNVTVTYNDTTGKTEIATTGSVSTAWNDITGKPTEFPPEDHTHIIGDTTGLQAAIDGKAATVHTHVVADITDFPAGTGGFIRLEDYGGNGNGVFDNITAISDAQADTDVKRVFLEDADYLTTGSISGLTYSKFYGPGRLKFGSTYRPASYHNILTEPARGTGVDLAYYFSGDTSNINAEHWKFGTAGTPLRVGLNELYFESVTVPYFRIMQSWMGYSGTTAKTTQSITTGATTVTLDYGEAGVDDLPNGKSFAFTNGQDGVILHTATSGGVSGSTLTFSPAIPAALTLPAGSFIFIGRRTHSALLHDELTHSGGGDAYIHLGRVIANYAPSKGQDHIFYTSTIGLVGGDLTCVQDGNFMTGIEINHDGTTTDCGCVGLILNFQRHNDTGARGAFWTGILVKSEGTKAITSGMGFAGSFNVGIDLATTTNFGVNKGAIGLKFGDRIHFDMQITPRGDYSLNSDTYPAAPLYIGTETVSGFKVIEMYAGDYRMRLSAGGSITTNAPITTAGNVLAGGVLQSNQAVFNLGTTGSKLTQEGGSLKLYKDGVVVQTW